MKSQITELCMLAHFVFTPAVATADTVVWDYGPTQGLISDWPAGNAADWQNFSDSVAFPTPTRVSGYHLYSESHHLWPFAGSFSVRFWTDNRGVPGTLMLERQVLNVPSANFHFLCNFTNSAGWALDLYEVSLNFEPVALEADTTYWVGAAGLDWDCGTYSITGPGDGRWAQMAGANLAWISDRFGDLMFQLVGEPIPEPSALAVVGLGVGVWLSARWRRLPR